MAQPETKVPFGFAQGRPSLRSERQIILKFNLGEKREPAAGVMPGGRIPTAGSQGMTLTQGAYMLLTFCPT
jgi:hypothetical protein